MKDESIYEIKPNIVLQNNMGKMKIVMVKGIGYILVSKDTKVNADLLLNIACSMEDRHIAI